MIVSFIAGALAGIGGIIVTFRVRSGTCGESVINNIGDGKKNEVSDSIISIVDRPDP